MNQPNGFEKIRFSVQSTLDKLFPERQIHLRTNGRVSFIRFTRNIQVALTIIFFGLGAWTTFTSINFIMHDKLLAAKDNQIATSRLAYKSLLSEVSEYQKKFKAITRDLEENHGLMLGLVEQNASLQQSLKSMQAELKNTETERVKVTDARQKLKSQLGSLEEEMRNLTSKNFNLKDNLKTVELDLQSALAARNQALFTGNKMRRKLRDLETRLHDLQKTEEEAVERLSEHTVKNINSMERVIKLSGLKVDKLIRNLSPKKRGMGGPFIEAKLDNLPASRLKKNLVNLDSHLERAAHLRYILTRLPLASPMKSFYINSHFGKRRDPITKRWAMHYGIDLDGPIKSSVYAPAPGIVKFSGWKGKYGRLIVIDHGAGIKTRYGHLRKTLVKKGQKVKFRQKIGLLGNSGRSTGAHLHYEIVYNNKPRDPMKFIRAGRYVLQQQK
ncbi:MAG: peptidoglycan DD-metalloendopeptidase family protein [Rhodospirillaceae bacterium]